MAISFNPFDNDSDLDELYFKAEMTYRQFISLSSYLTKFNSSNEIKKIDYFNRVNRCKHFDKKEVKKWLFNSWNTERILRLNKELFEEPENYFALQWSFPQAYYSCFSTTLAYFKTVGHNEMSHTAVLSKFGKLIEEGKYPIHISFYLKGSHKKMEFVNVKKFPTSSSMEYGPSDIDLCQNQICQFLKSTREKQLKEKREDNNVKRLFITKANTQKKILTDVEWEKVANMIGNTTLLNCLYRKRIKSNYEEIDTFNYEKIKAKEIHNCLIIITSIFNFINEAYIYKAASASIYNQFIDEYSKKNQSSFLENRMAIISDNF